MTSAPGHSGAQELEQLAGVPTAHACMHYCRYGIEPSCNYVDYRLATLVCTLVHVPEGTSVRKGEHGGTAEDRTICFVTGISRKSNLPF